MTRRAAAPLLAAVALLAAGCGGGPPPPALAPESTWLAQADSLVASLADAVDWVGEAGADRRAAARALRDDDVLYPVLVGYTSFGTCSHRLALVGRPTRRLRPLQLELALACSRFERASELFRRAVEASSPRLLVAASRASLAGAALLFRARAAREELGVARSRGARA